MGHRAALGRLRRPDNNKEVDRCSDLSYDGWPGRCRWCWSPPWCPSSWSAFLPGDAARALLGPNATEAQLAAVTEQLGLDKPLWEQYWQWLQGAVHGDLGTSLISRQPVTDPAQRPAGASLSLIIGATLVAGVVGVILGVRGARRGALGRVVDAGSIIGLAVPDFWLGLILVVVFAVQLAVLPPGGYVPSSTTRACGSPPGAAGDHAGRARDGDHRQTDPRRRGHRAGPVLRPHAERGRCPGPVDRLPARTEATPPSPSSPSSG